MDAAQPPGLAARFREQLDSLTEQIDALDGVATLDLTIQEPDSPWPGNDPTDGRAHLLVDLYDNTVEDAEQFFLNVETDDEQETLTMDEAIAALQQWLDQHSYQPTSSQRRTEDGQQQWSIQLDGGKLSPAPPLDTSTP